jgi:MFS family permease
MRFLRAFAVGLITAVAGMFLAIFASDYLTRLYHVSDMEGQRGMTVIFLFAPLGIIVGFVVGIVVALRARWPGFIGFVKTQGLSILVTIALATVVSGLFWVAADKPPKINGNNLTLDFELKVPPAIRVPSESTPNNIYASLYASNRDNRLAILDFKSIARPDGYVIIPGTAELMSHSADRELLASMGNETGASQFIHLNLPAAPRKEDETWSQWILATQRADLSPVPEPERIAVRYRVRELKK